MAEINLEAEQVVGEEQEAPPARKRRLFTRRKGLIFVAAIVVIEAVVLAVFFQMIGSGQAAGRAEAKNREVARPASVSEQFARLRKIDVGEVAMVDTSDPSPRADRRFRATFEVWVDQEIYAEVEQVAAENADALDLIKKYVAREIRRFLLDVGGESLKSKDTQKRIEKQLMDHLNENLPVFKNGIREVFMGRLTPARF